MYTVSLAILRKGVLVDEFGSPITTPLPPGVRLEKRPPGGDDDFDINDDDGRYSPRTDETHYDGRGQEEHSIRVRIMTAPPRCHDTVCGR